MQHARAVQRACDATDRFWGAQAASLQFAAACREPTLGRRLNYKEGIRHSGRMQQAGSLRSPEQPLTTAANLRTRDAG